MERICYANRLPPYVNLISQKMGIHEWAYDSEIDEYDRLVPQAPKTKTLVNRKQEVEMGFDRSPVTKKPNDVSTAMCKLSLTLLMHRMRRVRRHLPDSLHYVYRRRRRTRPSPTDERFPR